jgi:hypothetical protein
MRILAGSLVAAVVALSCTSDAANQEVPSIRAGELESHLMGMVVAPSMTRQAEPVDPAFSFAPDQTEIVVIVQVGKLDEDPPLDITWYRISPDGEEELFTHTVEVASFDRAFSVGVNEGTLAQGAYRITATMNGQTAELSFAVGAAVGDGAGAGSSGSEGAAGSPPSPGDSGAVTSEAIESPSGPGTDTQMLLGPPGLAEFSWFDHQAGIVEFQAYFTGRGEAAAPPLPFQISAAVDGTSQPVIDSVLPEGQREIGLSLDPCAIPGGRDLPGTEVRLTGTVGEEVDESTVTLAPDTLAPMITATSEPSTFSTVSAGDQIVFEVTAEEVPSGGPWQTGVERIFLREEGGDRFFDESYGEQPQPCAQKSWEQTATATYTVPDDPPPIIEIVASSLDFGSGLAVPIPNAPQESRFLFYTGEVWTGTMHTETRVTDIPDSTMPDIKYSCEGSLDADLRLIVAEDGTVSGEAPYMEPKTVCRGAGVGVSGPPESGTLSVTGTRSATEFRLVLFLVEGHIASYLPVNVLTEGVPIPITGTARAEREFRVQLPSGPATVTTDFAFELTCENCEEDVG